MKRRLLTIGHSYCVGLNRRLPNELAKLADWDVTVVGPARFRGDFAVHVLKAERDERATIVPVPVHCAGRVHTMLYGRRLASLLAEPWDVVHCWEETYVAAAAQVARRVRPDTPLVFASFQNILKRYPPPFNWIERYVMTRADGIVAFGRTAADVLERKAWVLPVPARSTKRERPPIAIIPPGVDLNLFRPDADRRGDTLRELGWSAGAPVVGFLGRLVPEKGLDVLTAALDRIGRPWRALFVGSGPLEGMLREWAGRYGDSVRIVTTAAHADVPRYLNAMDLLAAPSQTLPRWQEQFGRMLIEAFASGLPVVASSSGEIPYVVDRTGVLVGERDIDGWRAAIEALIDDAPRRCDLGRQARHRAETVFGWARVAEAHAEFFERLIGQRRGAAA